MFTRFLKTALSFPALTLSARNSLDSATRRMNVVWRGREVINIAISFLLDLASYDYLVVMLETLATSQLSSFNKRTLSNSLLTIVSLSFGSWIVRYVVVRMLWSWLSSVLELRLRVGNVCVCMSMIRFQGC